MLILELIFVQRTITRDDALQVFEAVNICHLGSSTVIFGSQSLVFDMGW